MTDPLTEAERYVYDWLQAKGTPAIVRPYAIATCKVSAHRVSHALHRLTQRRAIVGYSLNERPARWWVESIAPPSQWKRI